MTLVLALGVVVAATLGTLFSALYLSLKDASRTDLERRLEARYGEDAPSPEWLFSRMTRVEASVSLLRIICQVGVVVMMTAILGHDGGVWTADVGELIFAAAVSTLIVWISTSVLAALLLIPSCNHKTFAPILIVSSAIFRAYSEGRNTSTMSIGSLISVIFEKTSSPKIFCPLADGFTG